DICRLSAAFGTKARGDLMPLTRHAFNNFLSDRRIVFAALEPFVEQLDSEIGNFLASALRDLFFDLSATEFDFRNGAGSTVPLFSSSSSRNGFRPLVTRIISTRSYAATAVRVSLPRMSSSRDRSLRSSLSRL